MWLKLDDNLIDHPKFFTAGRHLGKRGRMRAFTVYMAGLSWVNRHLSDGEIPHEAVLTFSIDEEPTEVARVLVLKTVGLWHKTATGFRIHDYHDHNPKAEEIKDKRKRDRDRKREERGGLKRGNPTLSGFCPDGQTQDVHADNPRMSERTPDGIRAESSALARARSGSRPDPQRDLEPGAAARRFPHLAVGTPTHELLCRLVREELDGNPDDSYVGHVEGLKTRCAQLRLVPTSAAIKDALDAVLLKARSA